MTSKPHSELVEFIDSCERAGEYHGFGSDEFFASARVAAQNLVEQLEATEQRLAREISEHADAQAEYRRLVEQLEAARETLEQIAGPTLTSHRKTVDQLTDAVKWRQGMARDALVKLDWNPLRALAWIERKREDNTARTYTESSVSRTSKPASAPEATTSPANVGDALGSVTPRASGAENSRPAKRPT